MHRLGRSPVNIWLSVLTPNSCQVLAELADVRDLLVLSGTSVLSPRQLSVLQPEEEQEEHTAATIDPSIQFLGLEWEAIFGKCFNLGINIRIYRQRLDSGMVDTLTLALVLRDLHTVGQEVHHHSLAVTRSKLGEQVAAKLAYQQTVWQSNTSTSVRYNLSRSNNIMKSR